VADWDSILAAPIRGEEDQMGQALTRTEHTAEALREFAAQSRDGAQVRRLLAIALIPGRQHEPPRYREQRFGPAWSETLARNSFFPLLSNR